MPLTPGKSQADISANVAELRRAGHPAAQAAAIAYRKAGKYRRPTKHAEKLTPGQVHALGAKAMRDLLGAHAEKFCQQGANTGKPGPCPTGEGWASRAKGFPGRALARARAKVGQYYRGLEARYGRAYAVAILGAGLAGVAMPVPGTSLLTAAPVLAVAELHRRLSGRAVPAVAHAEGHKFSSTQIDLPAGLAARVRAMAAGVADEDLAEDGREAEPHVTVKYGLHTDDPADVRRVASGHGPVKLRLGKASVFPAKETDAQRGGDAYDVVKLDVSGPHLHRLNGKLCGALEHTDTHPKYRPHVTLAYVKPGRGQKYAGRTDLDGAAWDAHSFTFSDKQRRRTKIPLGAAVPAVAHAEPHDVTGEARDAAGKWTGGGSAGGAAKPSAGGAADVKLTAAAVHARGWPREITLSALKTLAREKLGKAFHGVVTRKYGGRSQVEVLAVRDGYHGRQVVRVATYPVPEPPAPAEAAPQPATGKAPAETPAAGRLGAALDREASRVRDFVAKMGYDPAALTEEQAAHAAREYGRRQFVHYTPEKLKGLATRPAVAHAECFSESGHHLRGVAIFRCGTHRGKTYTPADLDAMVENFARFSVGDKALLRVPAVLGHEEDQQFLERSDLPAAGWGTRLYREGDTLRMDFDHVPPQVRRLLKGKAYRKTSAEVYDQTPDGIPGKGKMLRRVAFLGGDLPQVKGMDDIPAVETHSERPFAAARAGRLKLCAIKPGRPGTFLVFSEVQPMKPDEEAKTAAPPGPKGEMPPDDKAPPDAAPPPEQPAVPMNDAELKEHLAQHGIDSSLLEGCSPQLLAEIARVLDAKDAEPEDYDDEEMPDTDDASEDESAGYQERAKKFYERARKWGERYMGKDGFEAMHRQYAEATRGVDPVTNKVLDKGPSQNGEDCEMPMKYSETEVRGWLREEIAAALKADAEGTLGEVRRFAEETRAAERKRATEGVIERLGREGKLPPAEAESVRKRLLRADARAVVEKFTEKGHAVELTEFDLQVRELESRPSKFAEKFTAPASAASDLDAEVAAVEAHYDRFSEDFNGTGTTREQMAGAYKSMRKQLPRLTAAQFLSGNTPE